MDNIKNDEYFIEKIKADSEFILSHVKNVDFDLFKTNEILIDSMLFRLIQISENAKKLSKEFKMRHSKIYWPAIIGLRNRIVHDYGNTDLNVIFKRRYSNFSFHLVTAFCKKIIFVLTIKNHSAIVDA